MYEGIVRTGCLIAYQRIECLSGLSENDKQSCPLEAKDKFKVTMIDDISLIEFERLNSPTILTRLIFFNPNIFLSFADSSPINFPT